MKQERGDGRSRWETDERGRGLVGREGRGVVSGGLSGENAGDYLAVM